MDAERDERIGRAYREHRSYLVDLAFRMLGDIGAAEDAVQDAYGRLLAAGVGDIADERGWLIVVTSRLCLDRIRSAYARREFARDPATIEHAAPARTLAADPADRVTLDDSVSLALLELLQRLTPAERVVYVLHDIFQMPFDQIAQIVGRTTPACRQLAKRARQRFAASDAGARFAVAPAEHRLVTEKFIAACANGDFAGLLEVLAPDAWGMVDEGPAAERPRFVVRGADHVARNLLRFWGPGATLVAHPVAGQPAVLGFHNRELTGVLAFGMRGNAIESVTVIADPAKLATLRLQLAAVS